MSKKPGRVPSHRLHRPSGQAHVIIDGEHIYLVSCPLRLKASDERVCLSGNRRRCSMPRTPSAAES